MNTGPPLPPFPFEHGAETGYRLCAVPLAAATPQATIKLARPLPGGGEDLLALVDHAGCLRVLEVTTQAVVAVYQIYRGSFLEEEEEDEEEERLGAAAASSTRVRPPEPCPLPWSELTFVPDRKDALFLLLGETNVVMYTTLPPPLDQEDLHGQAPRASASFAYGSPLIALSQETTAAAVLGGPAARIRTVGVDATGSVLASGDDAGCLRVWALSRRSRFGQGQGMLPPSLLPAAGGGGDTQQRQRKRSSVIVEVLNAHEGPLLKLAHGEALAREEGHIVTGGRDRTVKVWSWQMDEWGALVVKKLHTLLTEACDVRCLAAGGEGGLILGGGREGDSILLVEFDGSAGICSDGE